MPAPIIMPQLRQHNLTGKRLGRWVVLHEVESKRNPSGGVRRIWFCRCDCGTAALVDQGTLVHGKTLSCGCLRGYLPRTNKPLGLTGKRFGRLIVLRDAGRTVFPSGNSTRKWECACDCGTKVIILQGALTSGATQSCGCLQRERASQANLQHGHAHTNFEAVWRSMVARCMNPQNTGYKRYGGRAIHICAGWLVFTHFLADMRGTYAPGLSIDRIDNNAGYTCGHCDDCRGHGWKANCRWATQEQQANNTRTNRYITFNGKTQTLAQWGRELGLGAGVLWARLYRYGWPTDRAFTEPLHTEKGPHRKKMGSTMLHTVSNSCLPK